METRISSSWSVRSFFLPASVALLIFCAAGFGAAVRAQSGSPIAANGGDKGGKPEPNSEPVEEMFRTIYRNFYEGYRLGPGDEIAIRVLAQPDYSLPKVKVSPVGRVYHPLVGDVEVAGLTVQQLEKKLTSDFSEYIIDPKVTVSLEVAESAKIGVLGEVKATGIQMMTKPMTVLDVILAAGGFTDMADRDSVTLVRYMPDGRAQTSKVNVKRIIEGKARPEDNLMIKAGDTVIVHGNFKKKASSVMSMMGFVQFASFVAFGRVL